MTLKNLGFLSLLAQTFFVSGQISLNVELLGQADRGDGRYSGSWSYVAGDGTEYALIGAKTGTAAYCIQDDCSLVEVGFIAGPVTNWREITVIGNHAYVVTDVMGEGHGMQVISLGNLPDSLVLDTTFTTTFTTGHIIQKNMGQEEPFVYVMGTSTTQGLHILDVSIPDSPVEIGVYAPGYYIHDAHVRGSLLFAAAFYETRIDIVDISDKTNPQLVGTIPYEGKNTHSSFTSKDGKYLFVTDEADGYPARVFNIEDLSNCYEVATYSSNLESLVHNPYVKENYCFVSHNTEGLRVVDFADPELPVEVGFYDTWPGTSGGFNGLWSACPYFPSGKIIGANRTDGLFVWEFNNTRAARIYGVLLDSLSGQPLVNGQVIVEETDQIAQSNFLGEYKVGLLEGSYHLNAIAAGYQNKVVQVDLQQGDSIFQVIELVPVGFSGVMEKANIHQPSLFPNPSFGHFSIDLTDISMAKFVKVFDEGGRLVSTIVTEGRKLIDVDLQGKAAQSGLVAIFDEKGSLIGTARFSII